MLDSPAVLETKRTQLKQHLAAETCRIMVCGGLGCLANGAQQVYEALCEQIKEAGLPVQVELSGECQEGARVVKTGCIGLCEAGPLVTVQPFGYLYVRVKPEDAADIVAQTVRERPSR